MTLPELLVDAARKLEGWQRVAEETGNALHPEKVDHIVRAIRSREGHFLIAKELEALLRATAAASTHPEFVVARNRAADYLTALDADRAATPPF